MYTGLSIHKHLREVLIASSAIRQKVGERIYPIAAVNGTEYPFILCTRTALSPDYTKDGWNGDAVTVAIEVVSRSSTEAIAIAEDVREVLEEKNSDYLGWEVREPMLVTASEGYDLTTDTYVEALQFTFKVI